MCYARHKRAALVIPVVAAVLLLLVAGVAAVYAQTGNGYDLSWWTVDAGGYTFSTGGSYSLGGTIGQPDAGQSLSNGGHSLSGGFWTGVTALQRYPVYLPLVVRSQ